VPSADNLGEQDRAVLLGDAWHNPKEIRFTLTLVTAALLPNSYPADRELLADAVVAMRDSDHLQYKKIAYLLNARGVTGARGARIAAEHAFALYKKRKAYLAKRSAPIQFTISEMTVYPAES
jgi:hypothetical protein